MESRNPGLNYFQQKYKGKTSVATLKTAKQQYRLNYT